MKLYYGLLGLLPLATGFVVAPVTQQRRTYHLQSSIAPAADVDMDQYNLSLDDIAQEWTANLKAQTAMVEEGVYLAAKNSKENFVDTVTVEFPRRQGLGIELLEIAGGREDGLGITVVSGLVKGGSADGSGILVGDSISQVAVRQTSRDALSELEEETAVATECLGYDATVEAIGSLPPMQSDDEVVVVTLKRLRRKPRVTLNLQYPPSQGEDDITIELFSGENLRRAMLTRGVKLNDALSRRFDSGGTGDCGGEATCSTCVVSISSGEDLLNPIHIQEKQMLAKNPRWRLGCRAIVGHGMREGEMTVRVNPRQWDD